MLNDYLRILMDNNLFLLSKESIRILLSLFVSEVRWGQQGVGMVHVGVCPQVYLHLLYLVVLYIEHSWGNYVLGDLTLK